MSININPDTTSVTISGTTNTVTVVDTPNNVNISTTQPVTNTVTIAIPGPQGPVGVGVSIDTGSFATTGSNAFIGNQNIQGDLTISGSDNANSALRFLSGASITTVGSNIDMTAGPGGWSELGSNNGQNYVWVDDNGLNLVTSWDSNTETSAWRIATGSRQLTAVGNLNMNGYSVVSASNLATTGSNTFKGNQTISGSIYLNSGSTINSTGADITITAGVGNNAGVVLYNNDSSQYLAVDSTGSYANKFTVANNLTVTGLTTTQNQIVTGSTRGNITALSITSNTASIDLSTGNFFTLQLISGSNTYINPSNILPGQTSILTLSTTGSATVSFPSFVKQPSGSAYVPTATTGVDILTLASINTSSLYVVSVKNMI